MRSSADRREMGTRDGSVVSTQDVLPLAAVGQVGGVQRAHCWMCSEAFFAKREFPPTVVSCDFADFGTRLHQKNLQSSRLSQLKRLLFAVVRSPGGLH